MACRGVDIPDQGGYLQNEPEGIQVSSVRWCSETTSYLEFI